MDKSVIGVPLAVISALDNDLDDISKGVTHFTIPIARRLVQLAGKALDYARHTDDIALAKDVKDKLGALEWYAKQQRAELVGCNLLAAQRIKTERILGMMIPEQFPPGGDHSQERQHLADIGIAHWQSHQYQKLAEIDAEDLDVWIEERLETSELTTRSAVRYFATLDENHTPFIGKEWRLLWKRKCKQIYQRLKERKT